MNDIHEVGRPRYGLLTPLGRAVVVVVLVNLLLVPLARAQRDTASGPSQEVVRGELGLELDQLLARYSRYGFSGVVLVAKEGEVILHKAYGLADRERRISNTVDTVSNSGSVTKQFTAAAILKLEMQGKLSTSDPVGKHLESFPSDKAGVTIHHLLTHTSGLAVWETSVSTREAFIEVMTNGPLESAVGKQFRYSNAGYSLLAAIVERVSGQSWESYLREHLFRPAGMTRTGFVWEPEEEAASVTRGYVDIGGPRVWLPLVLRPTWHRPVLWIFGPFLRRSVEDLRPIPLGLDWRRAWGAVGAGGVRTTVADLYKWELALRGTAILSPVAKKKSFIPYAAGYAYGWEVSKTSRGTTLIHHSGTTTAFESQFLRYVDEDVVAIFLINNRIGWREPVGKGIEHVLFGSHDTLPLLILVLAILWLVGLLRMRRIRRPAVDWRREPSTPSSLFKPDAEHPKGAR